MQVQKLSEIISTPTELIRLLSEHLKGRNPNVNLKVRTCPVEICFQIYSVYWLLCVMSTVKTGRGSFSFEYKNIEKLNKQMNKQKFDTLF